MDVTISVGTKILSNFHKNISVYTQDKYESPFGRINFISILYKHNTNKANEIPIIDIITNHSSPKEYITVISISYISVVTFNTVNFS